MQTQAALAVCSACHTRSGVAGMSIWVTPTGESASMIALMTAGGLPTAPASPAPFTPSGIGAARHFDQLDLDVRQVVRARQRVVHEAAGQELARTLVIRGALQNRLPEALGDAAVNLAAHHHRVHRFTHVIGDTVADDEGVPGIRINLHLGNVAAVRESVRS